MKDAGIAAITGNQTTYTNPSGTSDIKTEIAKFMNRTRNLEGAEEIRASEVVVGPGAKPPLFFACQCLLQPGDEMIIPDPGFPVYKAIAQSCCCTYKFVPWNIRTFDLEVFEAALNEKTRVVIINSPSNPTGGVMPKEDLDKVMALCEKFPKCWVVSDEIYSQLTYDSMGTPPSALNCAPDPRPSRPSRCCARCGSPCAGALARPVDAPARHRGRRLQQDLLHDRLAPRLGAAQNALSQFTRLRPVSKTRLCLDARRRCRSRSPTAATCT